MFLFERGLDSDTGKTSSAYTVGTDEWNFFDRCVKSTIQSRGLGLTDDISNYRKDLTNNDTEAIFYYDGLVYLQEIDVGHVGPPPVSNNSRAIIKVGLRNFRLKKYFWGVRDKNTMKNELKSFAPQLVYVMRRIRDQVILNAITPMFDINVTVNSVANSMRATNTKHPTLHKASLLDYSTKDFDGKAMIRAQTRLQESGLGLNLNDIITRACLLVTPNVGAQLCKDEKFEKLPPSQMFKGEGLIGHCYGVKVVIVPPSTSLQQLLPDTIPANDVQLDGLPTWKIGNTEYSAAFLYMPDYLAFVGQTGQRIMRYDNGKNENYVFQEIRLNAGVIDPYGIVGIWCKEN